jgi:hypothetical protein
LLEWELAGARPEIVQAGTAANRERMRWSRRISHPIWWAAAAVLLVAATFAGLGRFHGDGLAVPQSVGRIVQMNDAHLTADSAAVRAPQPIVPGTLELTSGRITVEFTSGVAMEVSGPAVLEIASDMLVRLISGQATADVPRWARGFTITTPDVEVVDLGTRFGVAARPGGKTDVVVFEGEVDLHPVHSEEARFQRRLTQGEAARINRAGEIERIFQVHGDWLDNGWSTDPSQSQRGVIGAVWDNFGATKSVSYYQVVPGGLVDDCAAYVDHPHQWNGLTSDGLPELLRGADYVRTVNDYRYRGELSLRVEFAHDAMLLILFDNRVAVPEWLHNQFEDTGVDIGLDEDAWHGNPTFTVATGPGNSIDNVFSVWQRPCARGEVFVLGSMGVGREARAMYGIAAVAKDRAPGE